MSTINPTVGRKVWYYSAPGTPEQDATVIDVHSDRCVSLFVINRGGTTSVQRSVILVQPGDAAPQGSHATWMPFQVGQAQAAAVHAEIATKAYADGTTATGPGPLPDQSPAEQGA